MPSKVNLRTKQFWADVEKLCKTHEKLGLILGFYVIDPIASVAEVHGSPFLKQMLYDGAGLINNEWLTNKDKEKNDEAQPTTMREGEKPPGAKYWLPYLPEGESRHSNLFLIRSVFFSKIVCHLMAIRQAISI